MTDFKAALKRTGDAAELAALRKAGDKSEVPDKEGPVVIGLTGAGNVSTGSRDMLDALGVEWVDWTQLPSLEGGAKVSSDKFAKLMADLRVRYSTMGLPRAQEWQWL